MCVTRFLKKKKQKKTINQKKKLFRKPFKILEIVFLKLRTKKPKKYKFKNVVYGL